MYIELCNLNGDTFKFYSNDSNFSVEPHKVNLGLPKGGNYLITIDNGSRCLGFTVREVNSDILILAVNIQNTSSLVDTFRKEFTQFLEHIIKTTEHIRYIKIERPYAGNTKTMKQAYVVLKSLVDSINNLVKSYGIIFIQTYPVSWTSLYFKTYGSSLSSHKGKIHDIAKRLHPKFRLSNQDAYDAIGLSDTFMLDDISPGCFLRTSSSTVIQKRLHKPVMIRMVRLTEDIEDVIKDMLGSASHIYYDRNYLGYNTKFSLVENLATGFYYRPESIIVMDIELNMETLPILYKFKVDGEVYSGEKFKIIAHDLGGKADVVI